ncbi:formylglycine-generating enzyme family protein [Azovibrio restrictus]|uniref:formylglycine-generating enzyme family protein n=1 Tax=Azovibrio restrictus TaxID=146938 RepID=UPI0026E939CC|nr:formylglycine-generating enzyme family protein [Azovibrio restrictus]MDD3482749.1 formylglycine-generating enzyme family protein [Azovibrio restrictus]
MNASVNSPSTNTRWPMTPIKAPQAGRADLLRLLKQLGEDDLARAAPLLGYHRLPGEIREASPPPAPAPALSRVEVLPDLKPVEAPRITYWALSKRETLPAQAAAVAPPGWYVDAKPDPDDPVWQAMYEDRAPEEWQTPTWQPLLSWSRLGPWLRRRLGDSRPGRDPDVGRLLRFVTAGHPLRRIPMIQRHGWAPRISVLLGHASHLSAYREDINLVWRRLLRERGHASLAVDVVESPAEDGQLRVRAAGERHGRLRRWRMPASGTPLLILGDLGMLALEPDVQTGWLHLGRRLAAAGVPALVLCPVPAARVPAALARACAVHEWAPGARLSHPVRPGSKVAAMETSGVEALRAHIAPLLKVEPGLLRALRQRLGLHPVAEADLRRHPEIRNDGANLAWIGGADDAPRARAFAALPLAEQQRVVRLVDVFHGGTPSLAMTERGLVAHYLRDLPDTQQLAVLDQSARQSLADYRARLVRFSHESAGGYLRDYWLPDHLGRQGGEVLAGSPQLQALWAISRNKDWQDGKLELPDWLPQNADLRFFLDTENLPPRPCLLVQRGDRLYLDQQPKTLAQGCALAVTTLQGGLVRVDVSGATPSSRAFSATTLPLDLGRLPADSSTAFVDLGGERLWLETLRPAWAETMSRDADGLFAEVSWLGRRHSLRHLENQTGSKMRWLGEEEIGEDDHGLWADFTVETEYGRASQRMCWIPPGHFLMGSPDGEAERNDDEGPQHEVTLTRGYWLAETACTQALWRVVMGTEPSRFKGDDLPVEQVSWEKVQGFLGRLEELLPGMEASLPTEAEWEYACRAGTRTAYHFGDDIDREKANYGGIGKLSAGTVAVKSFEPNAWGLYQMHGNVLEWCADGIRKYDGAAQVDPAEPVNEGAPRAVRGGSWLRDTWGLRSAYRYDRAPGKRYFFLGFRLLLRSIEPGQARPGGPLGLARDAPGLKRKKGRG